MRFNCSHTFTIEADSREQGDEKLRRYSSLVRRASERLGIGYSHGLVVGNPGADRAVTNQRATADDKELETLFDD